MKTPSATYRIQFNKNFTFNDLDRILDYLHLLGVSTIYASPVFESTPGSIHGYDVTNPHGINPEIGSLEEMRMLSRKLKEKGMSWLQDIVPNHMAFSAGNDRLMDVLERGPLSEYYRYFDIDWKYPSPLLEGKLMVPFLANELDVCIENGDIQLAFSDKGFTIHYQDMEYPLSLPAYDYIATHLDPWGHGTDALYECLKFLPSTATAKNHSQWQDYKNMYIHPVLKNADAAVPVNERIAIFNKDKGKLKQLLSKQHYALTHWKQVNQEINYRRFFTISALICLRMEDEPVFNEYHAFIEQLYKEEIIQGVRIDHIDGLQDPTLYIARLRKLLGEDCYIIAEKILEEKEVLPGRWLLQGTTGYEFLSFTSQLLTHQQQATQLLRFYHQVVPGIPPYEQLVADNKQLILQQYMTGEWNNLVRTFFELDLAENFEAGHIKQALAAIMVYLPVYRIYPDRLAADDAEWAVLQEAFEKAKQACANCRTALEYLQSLFTGHSGDENKQQRIVQFLKRLMQFTGPLTAKGVEDTTFYVYNPLISHNEVGDTPSILGIPAAHFHEKMIARQQATPLSLNATATHDTKRGEDARVRINVLSEMTDTWQQQVNEWLTVNTALHTLVNGQPAPAVNDEYFIYQSIAGGFPAGLVVTEEWIQRLQAYIIKVIREAKVHSTWEQPHEAYEQACNRFIEQLFDKEHRFTAIFLPFMIEVTHYAAVYSLAQALIKITAPGIPDIYQGCELWDLSYVDPDNRRPVDYSIAHNYLQQIMEKEKEDPTAVFPFLQAHRMHGAEKLYVTWKTLHFRSANALLFTEGKYHPLTVTGIGATAVGYARQLNDQWVMVIVPVNVAGKRENDGDEYILVPPDAPRTWTNIFTGERIRANDQIALSELFADFPVAMLSH